MATQKSEGSCWCCLGASYLHMFEDKLPPRSQRHHKNVTSHRYPRDYVHQRLHNSRTDNADEVVRGHPVSSRKTVTYMLLPMKPKPKPMV